ncbi:hypothetical protein C8R44DRAFT_746133 [Mycena epipterygia]|nr:hypothetical protein C8R44DRAFT_746133 [Mycena epipterygia]
MVVMIGNLLMIPPQLGAFRMLSCMISAEENCYAFGVRTRSNAFRKTPWFEPIFEPDLATTRPERVQEIKDLFLHELRPYHRNLTSTPARASQNSWADEVLGMDTPDHPTHSQNLADEVQSYFIEPSYHLGSVSYWEILQCYDMLCCATRPLPPVYLARYDSHPSSVCSMRVGLRVTMLKEPGADVWKWTARCSTSSSLIRVALVAAHTAQNVNSRLRDVCGSGRLVRMYMRKGGADLKSIAPCTVSKIYGSLCGNALGKVEQVTVTLVRDGQNTERRDVPDTESLPAAVPSATLVPENLNWRTAGQLPVMSTSLADGREKGRAVSHKGPSQPDTPVPERADGVLAQFDDDREPVPRGHLSSAIKDQPYAGHM